MTIIITGCNSTLSEKQSINDSNGCPENPEISLSDTIINHILLPENQDFSIQGRVKAGQYIAYPFEAKSNQSLEHSTDNDIELCIYEAAKDYPEEVPQDIRSLSNGKHHFNRDGKYTLVVFTTKGSTSFNLKMLLRSSQKPKAPQDSPQATSEHVISTSSRVVVPKSKFGKALYQLGIDDWRGQLLIPFLINIISGGLIVIIGLKSFQELSKEVIKNRRLGELKKFWTNGNDIFNFREKYHIIFGVDLPEQEEANEPQFKYTQGFGIYEIKRTLEEIHEKEATIELHPLKKGESLEEVFFKDHVVIIGGKHGVKNFDSFCKTLGIEYLYSTSNEGSRELIKTTEGETQVERLISRIEDKKIVHDYGTIVRIVNPNSGKLVVIFDGNYGAGMLGAVKFATATKRDGLLSEKFNRSKHNFFNRKFNQKITAQQLVIEVKNTTKKHIIDIELIQVRVARDWSDFDVYHNQMGKAIIKALDES